MKTYAFGERKKPTIILLPGTACHWKNNFEAVVPLLISDFYVVAISYDGFDETEHTVFPDMLTETEKIEAYIKTEFDGRIAAAYGCSLGGSFVSLLVQRQEIHIDHAIIGSSDMDQAGKITAWIQGRLMTGIIAKMLHTGKLPNWMQKRVDKSPVENREYNNQFIHLFCGDGVMKFVQKESIYNQFVSDLVTPIENDIEVAGTTVHCFYAEKMGAQYEMRYRQHFKNPDIRRHNLKHEELLLLYPKDWVIEVRRCFG